LELNLASNRVSKIPANRIWPVMNSLLGLDLSNNEIGDNLEAGSFANLISLQRLDLRNNSVSVVPYQSLSDLNTIQYIFLDFNNITSLNRGAFGRLPIVFQLGLSHNNISRVSEKAFEGLLQLLHLNMSFNAISSIPTGAFHGLVSMRTLDLSHNNLERLDNKTHSILEDCLSLERVRHFD
jgi:Leucine-rich repeat (LRR) protein